MQTLKHSKQRDAILSFLMTRKDHPTADTIYSCLKEENPNLSLGTVYRNLNVLTEIGQIRRLRLSDGVDHFDGDISPHDHFLCTKCGQVTDLHTGRKIMEVSSIDPAFDGQIEGCFTYFYGLCGNCKEGKTQENRQMPG
ncbi:MAG: transcriptional repressor [Lachnospiraceae bacterium]|nr:transcriptional repressor [Lachnospiraceae bacterium]